MDTNSGILATGIPLLTTAATDFMNFTNSSNLTTATAGPFRPPKPGIWIGIVLSIVGDLLISVAMNVQKDAHNRLIGTDISYVRSWRWWIGLILMAAGEIGNFTAYGFAPASLVAPIGTSAVVANAILATIFLKEKIRARDITGITLGVVGTFFLIKFSQKEESMLTATDIVDNLQKIPLIIYLVIELIAFLVLVYLHYRRKYVKVVTILIQVALLGSLTVISAKAVSSMISLSFSGYNQLLHPVFYVMVVIMVVSIVGQVRYLNQAMAVFDATVVMPTNFVFFTVSAILSGIIFYGEFNGLSVLQVFMFCFGAVVSFIGVYFITGGRKGIPADAGEREDILGGSDYQVQTGSGSALLEV